MFMKESGERIKGMVMEFLIGTMVIVMKDYGLTINQVEREKLLMLMKIRHKNGFKLYKKRKIC